MNYRARLARLESAYLPPPRRVVMATESSEGRLYEVLLSDYRTRLRGPAAEEELARAKERGDVYQTLVGLDPAELLGPEPGGVS